MSDARVIDAHLGARQDTDINELERVIQVEHTHDHAQQRADRDVPR